MVRHWTRELTIATEPKARSRMHRARIINSIGVLGTGTVLVIVLLTKLTRGAWITLTIMALLYLVMNRIRRHYRRVSEEVAISDLHDARVLPAHVHAIVLASRLHQPTLRALTYAQSTHPTALEALTVDTGDGGAERLLDAWEEADIAVPLTVLDSPYRDITRPVINYVRSVRRESPRDLVVVFLPEYIVRHWWEQILHNQTALRLKTVLLFTPGVVVASVPWQLGLPGQRHFHHGVRARTAEGIMTPTSPCAVTSTSTAAPVPAASMQTPRRFDEPPAQPDRRTARPESRRAARADSGSGGACARRALRGPPRERSGRPRHLRASRPAW